MKNNYLSIVILFSLQLSSSYAYIASIALWKKGDKQVIVFGDVHMSGEIDICHRQSLTPFIEQLAKQQTKTDIILEQIPEEWLKKKKNLICLNSISEYAYNHQLQEGALSFVLGDVRRLFPSFDQIDDIDHLFMRLINKESDRAIRMLNILRENQVDNSELLSDLRKVQLNFNSFKNKVTNKEVRHFFSDVEYKAEDLINKFEFFFKQYKRDGKITVDSQEFIFPAGTLVAAFLVAGKVDNFSKYMLNFLDHLYIKPIREDLTNAFFVKFVMASQNISDNTIIYVGHQHAISINRLLLAFGYTLIYNIEDLFSLDEFIGDPVSLKELGQVFRLFLKNIEPR